MRDFLDFISNLIFGPQAAFAGVGQFDRPRPDQKPRIELFKGGGPSAPKKQNVELPKAPTVKLPPPPPPPAQDMSSVDDAKQKARTDNAARNGMSKTLLAGETGGYSADGKKSLLG